MTEIDQSPALLQFFFSVRCVDPQNSHLSHQHYVMEKRRKTFRRGFDMFRRSEPKSLTQYIYTRPAMETAHTL